MTADPAAPTQRLLCRTTRRPLLAPLFCLLLILASGPAQAQVRLAATLLALQGNAQVRRSGTAAFLPGFRKMPLGPGDLLRTGPRSSAHLLFIDGSALTLNQNSALVIPALAARAARAGTLPQRLQLQQGELWARLVKGRRLRFDTPTAVAGVRGTELNLTVAEDGATTLTVAEGEVSFSNPQGTVLVRTNQQSIARPGAAPTPPVTVNVPFVIEWTRDILPAVLLLETRFVGNEPAALVAAEAAAARLPLGAARWLLEGDVAHDRGQVLEALALYERALAALAADVPAAERARLEGRRAQALLELGRIEAAITAFHASIGADPAVVAPRLGLVQALLSRRQLDAALTEAQAAVALADAAALQPGGDLAGVRTASAVALAHAQADGARTPAITSPPGSLRLIAASDPATAPPSRLPTNDNRARAHLTLALVHLRRGDRDAAAAAVERALTAAPSFGQAHAWRAVLLRGTGQLADAESAARTAVRLDPRSAVAQQSLADVLFLQGRPHPARRAARQAVALNPLSAAAQVALGQAQLSLGEIEAAARAAHRAVALDPDLEWARLFLGIAMAQQRNLIGAERQLRQALALAPELTAARVLLARVLNEQGRRGEAEREARAAVAQAPGEAGTHSALGSILWRQGQLAEAAAAYQEALRLSPGSLVAQLELARVYLDQNRLPDALEHALAAVATATTSSEAHAILGLVYERGGNNEQALREYRESISLNPDNALARIGFALQSTNPFDAFTEFGQALVRDPSVPQLQFKPGVTTELSAIGGSDDLFGQGFRHRDQYLEGRLHDFSLGFNRRDGGWRGHDDASSRLGFFNLATRATPMLNAVYSMTHFAQREELSGLDFAPDQDGISRTSGLWHSLTGRYQAAPGTYVWLRGGYQSLRLGDRNPDGPGDGRLGLQSDTHGTTSSFELRLDQRLGRFDTLTYGYSTQNEPTRSVDLEWSERSQSVLEETFQLRTKDDFHYAQLDHRTGRLKLIAGALHARRIARSLVRTVESGQESVLRLPSPGDSRWQPYGVATVQVAPRTLVRLIGHERFRRFNTAALLPTEAFLTGELIFIGFGGGLVQTFELDLEHRFSPLLFGKLFLFRSDVRNLQILEPVTVSASNLGFFVPRARIEGFGVRLERQLTPSLAGYLRWTASRTTDRTQGSTQGWQLPQRPRTSLLLGLNFVDRAGTKVLLEGVHSSGVYAESFWNNTEGFDPLAPRPREPGRWLLNLRFGRERSVRQEWVFRIENLLNHAYSLWPGIPGRGRTASLELRWRF